MQGVANIVPHLLLHARLYSAHRITNAVKAALERLCSTAREHRRALTSDSYLLVLFSENLSAHLCTEPFYQSTLIVIMFALDTTRSKYFCQTIAQIEKKLD